MLEGTDTDPPHPILACGHAWDREEPWDDMAVILKDRIEGPEGVQPAVATGYYCRRCRKSVTGERLASIEEAFAWLRRAGA